jgi:hypothetical protein
VSGSKYSSNLIFVKITVVKVFTSLLKGMYSVSLALQKTVFHFEDLKSIHKY